MFSGRTVEGCEDFAFKNCSYAAHMGDSMPASKEAGILWETGDAESNCLKTAKTNWMNQVKDGWDTFMFKKAHNWDDCPLPEEVKKKLSGGAKADTAGSGMTWVSLDLGEES